MIPLMQMLHLPELELYAVWPAIAMVIVVFVGMRLIYGRWPWQTTQGQDATHIRRLQRQVDMLIEENARLWDRQRQRHAAGELTAAAMLEAAPPNPSPNFPSTKEGWKALPTQDFVLGAYKPKDENSEDHFDREPPANENGKP